MNGMDSVDLHCFLATARHRSLAGGARQLGVNHSTVFRRLNALEIALGVRLFDRSNSGYTLTLAGERLMPRAERIETELDAAMRELLGMDEQVAGCVRVTTAPELARRILPSYLPALAKEHPGLVLSLAASNEDRDLSRREADLALRATTRAPEHLVGRRVMALRWFAVASPDYVARHGRPVDVHAFNQHRLIGADDRMLAMAVFIRTFNHLPKHCFVASQTTPQSALRCGPVGCTTEG